MRIFRISNRIIDFNKSNISVLNRIFDYLNEYFSNRIQAQEVTYTTNMNTDVAGEAGDIVRCSTDNKFYGCTSSGTASNATWVSFN